MIICWTIFNLHISTRGKSKSNAIFSSLFHHFSLSSPLCLLCSFVIILGEAILGKLKLELHAHSYSSSHLSSPSCPSWWSYSYIFLSQWRQVLGYNCMEEAWYSSLENEAPPSPSSHPSNLSFSFYLLCLLYRKPSWSMITPLGEACHMPLSSFPFPLSSYCCLWYLSFLTFSYTNEAKSKTMICEILSWR